MRILSDEIGVRQRDAAMVSATGQGRAPSSARHSPCAPNTVEVMVAVTVSCLLND